MKNNKHGLRKTIKNNWFILKLAFKEAPVYVLHSITSDAFHQIIVFIEHIYMISYIVDCIQYKRPFINVVLFVGCVFFIVLLHFLWSNYANNILSPKGQEKINRAIRMKLYKKASEIDLECYDDPEFYTDFVWSMSEATDRVGLVLVSISSFIGSIAGMLVVGTYIISTNKIGLLFAGIAFLATLLTSLESNKKQFEMDTEMRPLQRKRDYINRVFYLNDYSKEIRLSDVKSKLYEDFLISNRYLKDIAKKRTRVLAMYQFMIDFVCKTFIFDGVYLIYLTYQAIVKNAFSYGTMLALYNSVRNLRNNLQGFSASIPDLQQHSMYIDKILNFLNYDIKIKSKNAVKPIPLHNGTIEIKNLTFSYNTAADPVLMNINLTIRPGEKVALVGYNGAGKSTLVKLILRLYDPTEGEILFNGINIKEYDLKQYRNAIGAVFQDYQLFATTLGQNLTMDSVNPKYNKALDVMSKSEFIEKFNQLKNGFDTQITKEYDENGVNLSGGESQKVAITRGLYKDCSIIILDEPSSALDPISEYNLNNTMLNISRQRTVIFISHRLSTTKMADKICMLENGCIIEEGNHEDLMKLDGKYSEMFSLQAQKYK